MTMTIKEIKAYETPDGAIYRDRASAQTAVLEDKLFTLVQNIDTRDWTRKDLVEFIIDIRSSLVSILTEDTF